MRAALTLTPLLLALSLGGAGCTLEDGQGFGRLAGRLWSGFDGLDADSGRLTAQGWFKTSNSFELKFEVLSLTLRSVQVRGDSGGGAGAVGGGACSFDPANPPAGCSLCHGNHCHCDGALKSYEELEALVCGGGAAVSTATTLASLDVAGAQDLRGKGTRTAELPCAPSCELDAGEVQGVSVGLDRLQVKARLRDLSAADRLQGAELTLSVDWDLAGASLNHDLPTPELVDRDHPYLIDLTLRLPLTAKAFDGVGWDKLQQGAGGTLTLDSKTNKSAGEIITTNLTDTTLQVTVYRGE